jgi:deoxycytidine triphosphate deaminase
MILSDRTIRQLIADKRLVVQGANLDLQLGPCSLALTISRKSPIFDELGFADQNAQGMVNRGDFVQVLSHELIQLPDDVCGKLSTKSGLARHGLQAHAASDMIAPGFHGRIQLELSTLNQSITIAPGLLVCELYFIQLDQPCSKPYAGRFQHQGMDVEEGGKAETSSIIMPSLRRLEREILPGR